LIDLIGTAAGGSTTDASRIMRNFAAHQFRSPGSGARMIFDGRRVSTSGAALAGGITIDSLDCHDGHVLVKGHVGVAVLPSLLALMDCGCILDDREFLACLVLGYEIATRAGIALHSTVPDFHSSGAWNALACASLGARLMNLTPEQTRQALGIAEYNAPRSQIMRVVDHPTMVKDGSGWGAMAGVSAAYLAADGFTGAPALTVERPEVVHIWTDLGERWRIMEQYFKAYPVCRWAQPAVEAALSLQREHGIHAEQISRVEVHTFHEGCRLATQTPTSTDEAQYSLPFPVAAALTCGRLGAAEVTGAALTNPAILRLSTATEMHEDDTYNARFPAERWAHVSFVLNDGTRLDSAPAIARGNPENPLSEVEIFDKYQLLAEPVLGADRTAQIRKAVAALGEDEGAIAELLQLILEAI
ncbi:MAG: MmgE/PrpD family protein, partial [Chloroflexota bacterium]